MAQAVVQGVRNALGVVTSPFVKMGRAYAAAAEKRPFTVGVVTTGIKTSAADLFAQLVRPPSLLPSAPLCHLLSVSP